MYLQALTGIEDFFRRHARIARLMMWTLVGAAVAASVLHLTFLFLLQRIEDPAAPIHWMMGRSMLNHLNLYEDIYETKPPGIFVLSALSLKMFGNTLLGNIAHTILLFSLPLAFAFHAYRQGNVLSEGHRLILMCLCFLGAAAIIRYLLPHPGPWNVDFYGAAFGMLFVLAIAEPRSLSPWRIALASLALFGALGMKEPFLLSILASAIILLPTPRTLLKGLGIPLAATAGAGIVALALTGWLHAYFSVYLPSMLGGYIQRFTLPLYQRGLAFDQVFGNLSHFSPAFTLLILSFVAFLFFRKREGRRDACSVTIALLLILALFFLLSLTGPALTYKTSRWLLGAFMALCVCVACSTRAQRLRLISCAFLIPAGALLFESFQWCGKDAVLFSIARSLFPSSPAQSSCITSSIIPLPFAVLPSFLLTRSGAPRQNRLLVVAASLFLASIALLYISIIHQMVEVPLPKIVFPFSIALLAIGAACFFLQWTQEERKTFLHVAVVASVLFLAIAAVSMGGDFQNQHFMAAVPFYAALLLKSVQLLGEEREEKHLKRWLSLFMVFAALAGVMTYHYYVLRLGSYAEGIEESRKTMAFAKESATKLDAILDRCNIAQYHIVKLGESDFNPFHGFTRHSPSNFFYWAGLEDINRYHALVAEREIRNFNNAKIVVMGDRPTEPTKPFEQAIETFLEKEFTTDPWPCAQGLPTIPHRIILYRRAPQA